MTIKTKQLLPRMPQVLGLVSIFLVFMLGQVAYATEDVGIIENPTKTWTISDGGRTITTTSNPVLGTTETVTTYPSGLSVHETSDSTGRKLIQTLDGGWEITKTWNSCGGITSAQGKGPSGSTYTTYYNGDGSCKAPGDPDCYVTFVLEYDAATGLTSTKRCHGQGNCTVSPNTTTTKTNPDGSTETYDATTGIHEVTSEKWDPESGVTTKTVERWTEGKPDSFASTTTKSSAAGSSVETVDSTGRKLIQTPEAGFEITKIWNPCGGLTSAQGKGWCGSTHATYYDGNSSCEAPGDAGCRVTSVQDYDARDGLETSKLSDREGNCTDYRKVIEKALITPGKPKKIGGTDGGKEQLQAEVLQQIEDKQRGDLTGSKATSQTGMEQPFREKFKVQPLPVGPLKVGQKEKLNITPRSQSTGKIFQGGAAAEKKLQTQAVQQNKFKPKYQRWGTSAGSSEAFRAPR